MERRGGKRGRQRVRLGVMEKKYSLCLSVSCGKPAHDMGLDDMGPLQMKLSSLDCLEAKCGARKGCIS